MMILAATVAGAVFLSNLMSDEFFSVDQLPVADARVDSIRLTSYDARDSDSLTDILHLNNTFNQFLCTGSGSIGTGGLVCSNTMTDANNLPSIKVNPLSDDQGTEFIVLQIRNMNINPVFIHNVLINNQGHIWDDTATGILDLEDNLFPGTGNYPRAGTFGIIPVDNTLPIRLQSTQEIKGDQEIRLIVKLSDNIPQDIGMWSSLRVLVNFGGSQPAEFIILSGDSKW